jgi:hypothetical protein
MSNGARRLLLSAVVGSMLFGGLAAMPAAAQSCDPAYISHCVPPVYEVGDLACEYFHEQGISHIQLADPYNDPMDSTAMTTSTMASAARDEHATSGLLIHCTSSSSHQ